MHVKVQLVECEEGPGYGATILAAVGCGQYGSMEEASKVLVRVAKTVEPDQKYVCLYEEKYQIFKGMYQQIKDLFPDENRRKIRCRYIRSQRNVLKNMVA